MTSKSFVTQLLSPIE